MNSSAGTRSRRLPRSRTAFLPYRACFVRSAPAPVIRYIHDAAKAAIEDPKFAADMANRGIDVDYRPGPALRADLWREYKLHTELLRRIGMLKK